jgi:hypothetical protein
VTVDLNLKECVRDFRRENGLRVYQEEGKSMCECAKGQGTFSVGQRIQNN